MKKLYVYCIHNPRTFSSSRGVGRRICACRCITAHPFWSSRLEFVLQQPITDSPKSKFTEKVPILYGRPTLSWILVSKSHSYYQIAFNLWWLSPKNYVDIWRNPPPEGGGSDMHLHFYTRNTTFNFPMCLSWCLEKFFFLGRECYNYNAACVTF